MFSEGFLIVLENGNLNNSAWTVFLNIIMYMLQYLLNLTLNIYLIASLMSLIASLTHKILR